MPGARTGLASRPDFAIFCDKAFQQVGVFIVDDDIMVSTKLANPRVGKETPSASAGWPTSLAALPFSILKW
jgi:hypothetical protein